MKEKRKTRLDKASANGPTEFIGFSAFATTPTPDTNNNTTTTTTTTKAVGTAQTAATTVAEASTTITDKNTLTWSPVYTGSDGSLTVLFSRIGQKRDANTKVKALQDLRDYFGGYSSGSSGVGVTGIGGSTSDNNNDHQQQQQQKQQQQQEQQEQPASKRSQVEALQHWAWLYHHKIHYDAAASVRAAALQVWLAVHDRIPKATDTICRHYVELLGMVYSTRKDPATEVRLAAAAAVTATAASKDTDTDTSGAGLLWRSESDTIDAVTIWGQGVDAYVSRILSYSRAAAMHEAIFMSRKTEATVDMNDQQKDAMEERFERIVGTALEAMELWLRDSSDNNTLLYPNSKQWWKTLHSTKTSLRRKTYQLLSTVCTKLFQHVPDDMHHTLAQVLSSEKEAVNIPVLLETLLSFLAHANTSDSDSAVKVDYDAVLTKPLGKILKKACYGAKVQLWGPMLLPVFALYKDALPLLQCVWQGRELTLGPTDRWALLAASAECAAFGLLRRNDKEKDKDNDKEKEKDGGATNAQAIAQLWLKIFEETVTHSKPNVGAAKVAHTKLVEELAKNLVSLEQVATGQRRNCAFFNVTDWFWTQGLTTAVEESNAAALARLLQTMMEQRQQQPLLDNNKAAPSPWLPLLRERFGSSLAPLQESSGAVPLEETYELFQAAFNFCGPMEILPDGLLEKFVMNDVLRWIVIHTSTLSTQKQSEHLAQQDFRLLSSCLAANEAKRSALWESLLREVVAAECNLELLAAGLKTLFKYNSTVDWIQCATLDGFVQQVGQQSVDHIATPVVTLDEDSTGGQASVEVDDKHDHVLELLRICLGLSNGTSSMIVSLDVLQSLIRSTHPSDSRKQALFEDTSPTPVLEVLLLLIQEGRPMMKAEQVDHALLESWRQGGRLYEQYGAKCIIGDDLVRSRFVAQGSAQLQRQLVDLCSVEEPSMISGGAVRWSDRAYRLLEICKPLSASEGVNIASPSFSLLGLDDTTLWKAHPEVLFQCAAPFLRNLQSSADRLSLLQGREENPDLAVEILLSLSEASQDAVAASKSRTRRDLCAQFISLLGGKAIDDSRVESWIRAIVAKTSIVLKTEDGRADEPSICKGVSVLSQLFDVMFLPLLPSGVTATINPSDITEGDQLWYITDSKNPAVREFVRVVKVHFDTQTGHFFSIRLGRDGESQERQTVLERLRVGQYDEEDREAVSVDSISEEEKAKRRAMRTLIVEKLIKPSFMSAPWTSSLPELVNIVVGQIGLGKERGLGTAHYDLFKLVSSIEKSLRDSLSNSDTKTGVKALWTLTLSFGFGLNAPSTRWIFKELRVDPELSYLSILDFYANGQAGIDQGLDSAVLAWLAISLDAARFTDKDTAEKTSVFVRAYTLLFTLASQVLESADDSKFSKDSMVATRAIYEGLRVLPLVSEEEGTAENLRKSQSDAMFQMVKSFASTWEGTGSSEQVEAPAWRLFSSFPNIFELSRGRPFIRELLATASASSNANHVSGALFVDSKRYFALQMIDGFAGSGNPLYSDDVEESVLSYETAIRLKSWGEGLEVEEAEELEEDFDIVSHWLPSRMMNEIETWHEETFHELDESVSIGRMLTWLSVLRFIDAAAPLDFRNRPAFVSYLGKCEAVDYVLNVSLLFDKAINDRKCKIMPVLLEMDDPLQDESSLELEKLASLVLFRTVQVLPSLSRRWWEESCPKVYNNSVQLFVEKHVAPKILQTELARIKQAATTTANPFGDMSVTGSLVSRQVTATYVQDDFTLTVLILLPACFPFRSAQVDCSKTLGVSQNRWKRWSLQITLMLNNQGGTLQDALMLWKDNVDKEFEGVEPCPVCYSVLHVKTHKLPALECKTCHNRFHVDCLTQWFKSSGKSQCVICQQPWQGSRIQ